MALEPFTLPPGLKLPDPKTLPPGFIETFKAQYAKLTPAQREEFIRENRRRLTQQMAERKLFTLYPPDGPLRRDLYQKHLMFFRAGGKHDPMPGCPPDCDGSPHNERAAIGGNRCITPWTPVQTDRGERRVSELLSSTTFGVRSWDGEALCGAQASGVFLKGIEPAFRVHLASGDFFDCSRKHRVLTTSGWLSLDQLVRVSSGLRCSQTSRDWMANYVLGDRPCDAGLLSVSNIDLTQLPSTADVHRYIHSAYAPTGASEPKSAHSRSCPLPVHPSIRDAPDQIEDLCELYEDPAPQHDAQWSKSLRQMLRRLALGFGRSREALGSSSDQDACISDVSAESERHHDAERTCEGLFGSLRIDGLHLRWANPGEMPPLSHHDAAHTWMFFPSTTPSLICGEQIVSISPIGVQPILDFTVEGLHNYRTAGVIHHNSGKSTCTLYELTCHLTGIYGDWWQGRRFDRPISAWAAGEDVKAVRESLQTILLGPPGAEGTGMIPKANLVNTTPRAGVPEAVDTITIKHHNGKSSRLLLKTYDQGRESFQASKIDVGVCDEEPPSDIYSEMLTRTMSTVPGEPNGIMLCGFTPLKGISDVVLGFLPGGKPRGAI